MRAVPPSAPLSGLMKWLRRDPWSDAFGGILEQHLARACSNAGIEISEIAHIIGDERVANLWGCAFEDFLTRDFDGIGNIVDDYLKRRGWNEKASNRAYMSGLRSSVMSLYEVSDIKPGKSFLARDLVRGGEPIRISERSATQSLKQWDRIAARVVGIPGKTVIAGGVLGFDAELSETLLESLRRVRKQAARKGAEVLRSLDRAMGPPEVLAAFAEFEVLRLAAPMISVYWLDDLLEKLLNPKIPELRNSDGEEIVFLSLHYRLLPGVSGARVEQALGPLTDLRSEPPAFWNWVSSHDAPMEPFKSKTEAGHTLTSTMEDGALVLGTLELNNNVLVLSVNSESRAERGRAMLAPVLEGLAGAPLTERQTVAQAMANGSATKPASKPSGLSREEERRAVHASMEAHYRGQLDQPIPALGDVSPRQAARTAEGRDKLVGWLKELENHLARHDASDPMADFDVSWMWDELKIADRRK